MSVALSAGGLVKSVEGGGVIEFRQGLGELDRHWEINEYLFC